MMPHKKWLAGFSAILLLLLSINLSVGLHWPLSSVIEQQIFWQLRIPLVLCCILVGGGLAVCSALLQVLLRNPLADPGIIGISSGASLFAAIFLLAGGSEFNFTFGLPLFCFIGALLSTSVIYLTARRMGNDAGVVVILAGIGMATIAGAIIGWLYYFADAQSMRNLIFWLMGSLHQADAPLLWVATPVMAVLFAYSMVQGQRLNWLYFGSQAAELAGLDVHRYQRTLLLVCALLAGIAVSLAGSIAFVGLLVPHLLRNFFGHDNRFILPASALCGASLLLAVNLVSHAFGGVTVPVSMLTATLGGPIFIYSVIRLRGHYA